MAELTANMRLKKPDPSDYYNIADQNGNMDKLDAACVISETVRSLRVITRAAYDALTVKQNSILYLVQEEDSISLYLGSIRISGCDILELTQAEYDALETYDNNTLYAIPEEVE